VEQNDEDCDSDTSSPPWHKFRFLITRLVVKGGVTRIGNMAFAGLSRLESVTIEEGVTYIPLAAFANCEELRSMTIPRSIEEIGGYAFQKSGLKALTIPSSVTSILDYAFASCTSLTFVTIENGVHRIGDQAFFGCTNLLSVTIPNSITTIGSRAFYDCSSLSSVTIPHSVTTIGRRAFYGCTNLTSIDVDNDNPEYSSVNGVLFNNAKDVLVQYPNGKQDAYTIPSSVMFIGIDAFSGNTGLMSITIPESVTLLGGNAFGGCVSLTSVTCLNPIPPTIYLFDEPWTYKPVFDSLPSNTCLYVPASSINAYRHADEPSAKDGWASFKCIKPISAIGGS
jgi:hypothetical protein